MSVLAGVPPLGSAMGPSQIATLRKRGRVCMRSAVLGRTSKAGKKNAAPHAGYLFFRGCEFHRKPSE